MKYAKNLIVAMSVMAFVGAAFADAEPNKAAPNFEATDASGKTHKRGDFAGNWLVLEWFNKDCPFVKKHYGSNNMQKLQKRYTDKGVVWLQVISSAPGKQGNIDSATMLKLARDQMHSATATLFDPSGTMGKSYGAKTTPHMFVIDPKGIVVYAGAIDDNDSPDPSVISDSKNYVATALDSAMSGGKVEVAATKSYGCSVKY